MRNFLVALFLVFSSSVFAGGLGDRVLEMLGRIDSCGSAEMVGSIIKEYEDITYTYGADWRSYYWIAYACLKKAEFSFDKDNRDQALNDGLEFVRRSRLMLRDHPELDILESLLLVKKIEIDPAVRENKYRYRINDMASSAFKADQLNPRYYYLKGVIALNDTVNDSRNRQKAIDFFLAGEKLFGPHDKNAAAADPTWGFDAMQLYLNVLVPNRSFYYNRQGEKVKTMLDVESVMELKDIEKELKQQEKAQAKAAKKAEKAAKKSGGDEVVEDTDSKKAKKEKEEKKKKEKAPKEKKVRNLP